MIRVERLNGEIVYVNPDLVRAVGERPDTILTFVDGSTMTILGQAEEFLKKWNEYRAQVLPLPPKESPWK
jgi:uncharacterized protein YlzI (FlbEa/FlbD family)